jgi:hypothetical protein
MFALFQMMANLGMAAGEGVATSLSANLGFTRVFWLLAAANVLILPLFLLVLRRLEASRGTAAARAMEAEAAAE